MTVSRPDVLITPRGLSRKHAASYVGVSPTLFGKLVRDGRMPKPKKINRRLVWDRSEVDAAFDELTVENTESPQVDQSMEANQAEQVSPIPSSRVGLPAWMLIEDPQKRQQELDRLGVEWEKNLLQKPLGKLETKGLAYFYEQRGQAVKPIKGVSMGTMEKLEIRGFVAVIGNPAPERGHPDYTITDAGIGAWESLCIDP